MTTIDQISKISDYIYIGTYLHSLNNTEEFLELKIDVVFNCASEIKYPKSVNLQIEKFNIYNNDSISFIENMDEAIKKMKKYLSKGKRIYLTCNTGNSRSVAIFIYYLMMSKNITYNRAFLFVKRKRSSVCIDDDIENALKCLDD